METTFLAILVPRLEEGMTDITVLFYDSNKYLSLCLFFLNAALLSAVSSVRVWVWLFGSLILSMQSQSQNCHFCKSPRNIKILMHSIVLFP